MATTKKANVTTPWTLDTYQGQGDGPLALTSHSEGLISSESEVTGETNPGWRLKLRHSSPATTIASGVRKSVVLGRQSAYTKVRRIFDGQVSARLSVGHWDWEQVAPTTEPPDAAAHRLDVANKALSEFLKRAKNKQRQIMSGVFLGELRQTLNLIRRPLLLVREGLDEYVYNIRRIRLNRLYAAETLSREWLSFQFGIKPLIADIEGGVASLVRFQHERAVERVSYTAGSEVQRDLQTSFINTYAIGAGYTRQIVKKWTCSRRLIGAVYVEPNGPIAVQQSWGLGTRDFIPTVYELIPYSFLVDYFVNLGDIINAWSFNQADLAWHNDTLREEFLTDVTSTPFVAKESIGNEVLDSQMTLSPSWNRITTFTRRADPLGLPTLAFRLPGLGLKALNIAALATLRVR